MRRLPLGDLPKNCHLLPSAAILYRQNRYTRFSRFHSSSLEGAPARLGPRAENRERAERNLGARLSPCAVCPVTVENNLPSESVLRAASPDISLEVLIV